MIDYLLTSLIFFYYFLNVFFYFFRLASVQEQRLPPTEPQINEDPPRSADVSVADKVSVIFFYFFITNCGPCRLIPTSHPTPCSHKKALHFSGLKITKKLKRNATYKKIKKKIPNRKKLNQQHLPYISLMKKKTTLIFAYTYFNHS